MDMTIKVTGTGWCIPPTEEDLKQTSQEIADSRLHRHEPPNRGVTLDDHLRMVIRAVNDKESIKDLIPCD